MLNENEKLKKKLAEVGLNIFLSTRIKNLPNSIREYMLMEKVPLDEYESIILVGNGGQKFWTQFPLPLNEEDNPLDTFSLNIIKQESTYQEDRKNIMFLYPNQNFTPPLQQLSRFFQLSFPSPLGLDISHEFGPWFAFRALFLSKEKVSESFFSQRKSPCESCLEKPCLSACPVQATAAQGLNIQLCAQYRLSKASHCEDRCLSRLICPVGAEHQYCLEQIQYHMLRHSHLRKLATFK